MMVPGLLLPVAGVHSPLVKVSHDLVADVASNVETLVGVTVVNLVVVERAVSRVASASSPII